ncbi:MAG TPA: ABC transporter substrate binding protein [Gammaproteobacteria bacterium]|nr:ABC transporter substrate binding protein [Gammaproteobacteria bacterium]
MTTGMVACLNTVPGLQDAGIDRFHAKRGIRLYTLFVLLLSLASANLVAAGNEPYRVLVLHSFRNSLPVTTDWYEGMLRGFSSEPDLHVEIDSEAPNLARFVNTDSTRVADKERFDWLLDFYHKNYQDRKPHLIISTDTPALRFLLVHGDDLFPGVPIVFVDADHRFVRAQQLPAHITGISNFLDITGTLELILDVHPDTRRVAVIVGSARYDLGMERVARQAMEAFAGRVEFVWLRGLPIAELVEALNTLPERTVALYLVQTQDRTGKTHIPRAYLQAFSAAAKVPVYGLWDTLLEHGIVGGRLVTVEEDGYQAARLAVRILRGESPADLSVVDRLANPAIFDGAELARWNIRESRLPAGSLIRNRPASAWAEHRREILIALSVILAQATLIFMLILNRRRLRQSQYSLQEENTLRREMETLAVRLRERLARFSKERSLGTMATTIAHEINQPLIAIQNYAQAARRRLQADVKAAPKLIELVEKIEGQAERAGDITRRVRSLVNHDVPELRPVSLSPLLQDVIRIMEPESESRGCHIRFGPAAEFPPVLADALQVQLVFVNLLHNALHSVCEHRDREKLISVEVCQLNDDLLQVSVTDNGSGVPRERAREIFEPLYSDKRSGMGMGLAICRDIIEAHGGRIWYDPNPEGGAVFRFTLRKAG